MLEHFQHSDGALTKDRQGLLNCPASQLFHSKIHSNQIDLLQTDCDMADILHSFVLQEDDEFITRYLQPLSVEF